LHRLQLLAPAPEKDPASHGAQPAAPAPLAVPAPQLTQTMVEPAAAKEPGGQALQLTARLRTWYAIPPPASAGSSDANVPAAHEEHAVAPAADTCPVPQARHVAADDAARAADAVPAGHGWHGEQSKKQAGAWPGLTEQLA
jgi:hypothetical protein